MEDPFYTKHSLVFSGTNIEHHCAAGGFRKRHDDLYAERVLVLWVSSHWAANEATERRTISMIEFPKEKRKIASASGTERPLMAYARSAVNANVRDNIS